MEHRDIEASVENALRNIFGENIESGRFIDATKIPFICKDIEGIKSEQVKQTKSIESIHEKLDAKFVTKERFWPVQALVFGCTAILLTGMVFAFVQSQLK